MASGSLEVEVIARTEKLEAGLKKTEAKVSQTSAKMNNMGSGLGKAATGMIKLAAHVAAVEIAAKSLTVVTKMFKGDMEGALEAAKALPLGIGPAIAALEELMFAITGAKEELEKMNKEFEEQQKFSKYLNNVTKLTDAAESRTATLQRQIKLEGVQSGILREEAQIYEQIATLRIAGEEKLNKLLEQGHELHHKAVRAMEEQLAAEEELLKAKAETIRLQRAGVAEEQRDAIKQQNELLRQQLLLVEEQDVHQRELLSLRMDTFNQEKAIAEERAAIEEKIVELLQVGGAATHEEVNALTNQKYFLSQQLDIIKEINEAKALAAKVKEAERLAAEELRRIEKEAAEAAKEKAKAEKEAADELKKQLQARQALADAQEELVQARADAETGVASQTSTLATAGGAFTVGMDAQLNEAKLMRGISEKSKEILFDILQAVGSMANAPGIA